MRKYLVVLLVLLLAVGLMMVVGCGGEKETEKQVENKQTTEVDNGEEKKLEVSNVASFPDASANGSGDYYTVVAKVTNPYEDYYCPQGILKITFYDEQGVVLGTNAGAGNMFAIYPGSIWSVHVGLASTAPPARVETEPVAQQGWQKISGKSIPKYTITQSTLDGQRVVGSVRYEGSNVTQIGGTGVLLNEKGEVVNYGLGFINTPVVGDNPFELYFQPGMDMNHTSMETTFNSY